MLHEQQQQPYTTCYVTYLHYYYYVGYSSQRGNNKGEEEENTFHGRLIVTNADRNGILSDSLLLSSLPWRRSTRKTGARQRQNLKETTARGSQQPLVFLS